ncbi:site-specific DNA-methyltransferase [Prevotella hominis]|uniref:site-specific DNA-methyltransferase n=1 Tax=Segatella hominis TaxID=2518605 RepID=UPI001F26A277|nr:site-specific DNA-methyltransferase [Segatella hominis]MCF2589391.1 site-specific DNA-methyltransferase [Segatella hominis]
MNKYELAKKINELEGLTNDEKSELIKLLRSQKKYGLVWEDKPEDAEQRMVNEQPVLVEVPERAILSDDAEAPNHILIEGDNLEALTALSYTHAGKIDVIYIDPPYNTGNKDFIYNDSFVDKEDGYRHSKWLSFMNKRLKIAKNLLADKGVIFISIDDNEQAPLKLLCDEIFGERNFVAKFDWRKKTGANDAKDIAVITESILLYSNSKVLAVEREIWNRDEGSRNMKRFKFSDEFVETRGKYYLDTLDRGGLQYSDSMNYGIEAPDGGMIYPNGRSEFVNDGWIWKWGKDKVKWGLENKFLEFVKSKKSSGSKYTIKYKVYENVDNEGNIRKKVGRAFTNFILEPINQQGNSELMALFGEVPFSNPKPLGLLQYLLNTIVIKDVTILDFFAGSGTTLHATMQLNAEDGGHRQCILVTNNENGICENVTYERNRRVILGYTTPKGEKVPGLTRNNLRYYKTKFVPRDKSPKNLRNLMALSTDMLCIHNDTYIEKPFAGKNINNKIARYFESNDGTKRMLVIYRAEAIQALVELMKQEFKNAESKENGKLMVYVFSPNGYAYDDEFEDVADYISLCAMPDAVQNAYRRVLPKKRQAQLLEDVAEETDSEARTVEESDLFQNQTYTMAASEIKDNREGGDE